MADADRGNDGAERPPIRLVTRLLAEMQTSVVAAGLSAFAGDLDRFVVYTLILRQSVTGPEQGDEPTVRAISINSLAASLGRSFETIRRHVHALVSAGLCLRTTDGLIALDEALDRVPLSESLIVAHDAFVRMVEDMTKLGLPLPSGRRDLPYRHEVGVNAAVDIMLAVLATNIAVHREWLNLVLYSTVLCGNVRSFAHDAVQALLYVDETQPVPVKLLRPVSAGAIARAISVPASTVRRRVAVMVADGRLERVANGLVVSQDWLNKPESVAISRASWQNIRRILGRAAAAGFPFDAPAEVYMRGRPPLVPIA